MLGLGIQHNRLDIVVHDKKRNEILLIKVGITPGQVETEKQHKYDLLAKEMSIMYKCSTWIIPYVMTWEGIVTKFHHRHLVALGLSPRVEAYIQTIVIKKTLESIFYEHRRGLPERGDGKDAAEQALERLVVPEANSR